MVRGGKEGDESVEDFEEGSVGDLPGSRSLLLGVVGQGFAFWGLGFVLVLRIEICHGPGEVFATRVGGWWGAKGAGGGGGHC